MKIAKVYNDDWCGLYVDGKLIQEGHSINFYDFMKFLLNKGTISEFSSSEVVIESNLPDSLDEVNFIEDEG